MVLFWSIQVSVTMPRRKDLSNDLRKAIVAANKSGEELFRFHCSTMRKIIHNWKTFKTVANLPCSGHSS